METVSCTFRLAKEGLSTDDVRVARVTVYQEIRPGAGFKTGDFIKEKLGGGYRRTNIYQVSVRLFSCARRGQHCAGKYRQRGPARK